MYFFIVLVYFNLWVIFYNEAETDRTLIELSTSFILYEINIPETILHQFTMKQITAKVI